MPSSLSTSTAKWLRDLSLCGSRQTTANPNERQPGTLSRWEYTEVDAPEAENEDAEPVTPCGASKRAVVVHGAGVGTMRTVCTDPECPVHRPSSVVPIDPDAEARRKECRLRLKRLQTSLLLAP
jgi:hypothetical protein